MPPEPSDLRAAVAAYWKLKAGQLALAEAAGSSAEGTSKAVRGGGHFAPIAALIARFFTEAGYPVSSIATGQRDARTTLPGYFRPTKDWDLVVSHRGVLVAAIELKALGGPSFGNNYNNRIEEALGNAVDLSRANLQALVGPERPWLGYFFVMEDHPKSRAPGGRPRGDPFVSGREWSGRSYQERFVLTGERLIDEGTYDALCYVVSSPQTPAPIEPSKRLDWRHFSAAIQARIAYLANLGYP
ncbi:MAG: type II site-specific deoxyribonuclease [Actinobacteria bacterium]|nr:type II site-specific deoxyribonuclease [Actinomycetota bacterium]